MEITSTALDEQTKQLIKATVPILQKHGTAITKTILSSYVKPSSGIKESI